MTPDKYGAGAFSVNGATAESEGFLITGARDYNTLAAHNPTSLNIDCEGRSIVTINLATGEVEIHDEAHMAEAPRIFWEAIAHYGRGIVAQRDEAIGYLRELKHGAKVADFLNRIKEAEE